MKVFKYPKREGWISLIQRPYDDQSSIEKDVKNILKGVRDGGDQKLVEFSALFDKVSLSDLKASVEDLESLNVSDQLKSAIELAKNNIEKFHKSQRTEEKIIETYEGVKCWRKSIAIEKVGLYIPGGSAPLISTVLMLGVPAKLAGCKEIVLCTPPDKNGKINSAILYTANLLGINNIFKIGGAQAIAAMAYGTESVPKVDKVFGPGNQYVTKAKEIVQMEGTAIDMPAGPSELLVIADGESIASFVAADLLSQAEHGPDSQVILLSDSESKITEIKREMELQLERLPRKDIAKKALDNSKAILLRNLDDCVELSNSYAPEHLIINTQDKDDLVQKITNAGSVFIGQYSCESAGDYASGTNHTLPTNGFARNYSGVSLDSFVRKVTFQEISRKGLLGIGPAVETLAAAEDLQAHKNAVSVRLNYKDNV